MDMESRNHTGWRQSGVVSRFNIDRKSTRLNSSHDQISYAVFCLKKKKDQYRTKTAPSKCMRARPRLARSGRLPRQVGSRYSCTLAKAPTHIDQLLTVQQPVSLQLSHVR